MNWFNRFVVATLPAVPKPVVRIFSNKYIAGESREHAIAKIRELKDKQCMATVDILGEFINDLSEAASTVADYTQILDRIEAEGVKSHVSVKLTQLGLLIDEGACYENTRKIAAHAQKYGNFMRIDMEDSSCTTATLNIFKELCKEFGNVGIVIQAYLRRSMADIEALLDAVPNLNVRLCKGIYVESRAIAYKDPAIINYNFMSLLRRLLEGGAYVGIATHDEKLVWHAQDLVKELKLKPERYEFQMLLGVDEVLREIIIKNGHRVRVYVPFGQKWYAYSLRRLKENPSIAGHIIRGIFRR